MKYKVIDNFLPKKDFESIRDMLMHNKDFPWFYHPDVTYLNVELEKVFYFCHIFYKNNAPNSAFLSVLDPLISKLDIKALIKIKSNLYPNIGHHIQDIEHTDYPYEHKGAIYYINTNNGPTTLDDGTEIESVENRILLFESHKMHNSYYCTDKKTRVNININYF